MYGHSASTAGRGVFGEATGASGATTGVSGQSASPSGRGVSGQATAATGGTTGVWGEAASSSGRGMVGWATAATGDTTGVWGQSNSTTGKGVYGWANATSGDTAGVYGVSSSSDGRGVVGWSTSPFRGTGVVGQSNGDEGTGVFGWATATGDDDWSYGVRGVSASENGVGVSGYASHASGYTVGVRGTAESDDGVGVVGIGEDFGVRGECETDYCTAVGGIAELVSNRDVTLTGGYFGIWSNWGAAVRAATHLTTGSAKAVHASVTSSGDYSAYFTGVAGSRNYFERAVGIGSVTPGFLLEVNGTAGKPGGGSWAATSDRRLKRDIRDLEGSLDSLLALRGVSFEYIDPEAINERPGERIGMVAQEVEQVFPDWVDERADGYKALTFRGFEALTVEALRELRAEKDAEIAAIREQQASQHAELARENADLRARLEGLENQLRAAVVEGAGGAR